MKKYYNTLNKENKTKIKQIYQEEYKNTDLQVRLVRLLIFALMGYITASVLLIDALLNQTSKTLNLTIAIILFIISTVFIIGRFLVKQKVLNKIAIKNKEKLK